MTCNAFTLLKGVDIIIFCVSIYNFLCEFFIKCPKPSTKKAHTEKTQKNTDSVKFYNFFLVKPRFPVFFNIFDRKFFFVLEKNYFLFFSAGYPLLKKLKIIYRSKTVFVSCQVVQHSQKMVWQSFIQKNLLKTGKKLCSNLKTTIFWLFCKNQPPALNPCKYVQNSTSI